MIDERLHKGVFWIKDAESIDECSVCIKALCDKQGNFIDKPSINPDTLSKNKTNFNHQKVWKTLDKRITGNKTFNYYPRGRIEIKNGKAIIYANVSIATEELKSWAISILHLTLDNGIKEVVLKADGSNHYKSYMESGEFMI